MITKEKFKSELLAYFGRLEEFDTEDWVSFLNYLENAQLTQVFYTDVSHDCEYYVTASIGFHIPVADRKHYVSAIFNHDVIFFPETWEDFYDWVVEIEEDGAEVKEAILTGNKLTK